MRRRIREAIVAVSAVILITLGIPLALVAHQSILRSEVVTLQARTADAMAEIDLPFRTDQLDTLANEPDSPPPFTVYDAGGRRVYGHGPRHPDAAVRRALQGDLGSTTAGRIVVAMPIVELGSERVRGVLRTSTSLASTDHRSRVAWAEMAAVAIAALALAWLIGNRLARTLSAPLAELGTSAASIGHVGDLQGHPASGIEEIDALAAILDERARAVYDALARERHFGADVSHQLRTPVTALRLKLEAAQGDGGPADALATASLADLDRIEETIAHLLAVARGSLPVAAPIEVGAAVHAAVGRWRPRAAHLHRGLEVTEDPPPGGVPTRVRANRESIDGVLDVLVDNALRHGRGTVRIGVRPLGAAVAVDVADDGGDLDLLDAERLFERGHGRGHGIGLAVARAMAEAEGGRLEITADEPTTFTLLLLAEQGSA